LLLADQTLFVAGPPDVFKADDPAAAFEGRAGGVLLAVAAADGETLADYSLDSPPVFDGMAAVNGRLLMATVDGDVVCLAGAATD
jgi:hypothetical protein